VLRILAVLAGLATLALSLPVGAIAFFFTRAVQSNVGDLSFEQPLKVPPLLEPELDGQGRKVFDLRFQAGTTELLKGRSSETLGLNGTYLGPTLRAARGDEVLVNIDNGTGESTTLHWHGMHLPAAMDGGPHQMIAPGETWSPTWRIDQPAASLWYHPHLHGATAEQVYRGAAGMFIVDDEESQALDLPDTYGVDDIPLIIQDKQIEADGDLKMSAPFLSQVGMLGDEILVNGTHDPHVEVTTELVRFRVLNASNGRVYDLGFDDDAPFWQIASDSGLLEAPHETRRLQLSPGERAEIVVAVEPGERAVLRSFAPDLGANFWGERFGGGDDTFDIIELRGADDLDPSTALPGRLVDIDRPSRDEVGTTRSFRLSGNRINGREMDMERIDEVVPVDTTEIWELTNADGAPHNFHPHLVHFAVLDIDGSPPPPPLAGWKDTIYLPPNTTVRIIARFDDHADPDTPFMFHCHVLLHEDQGMMGQFTVE
jgi:FtsP/CotA-like multicopper oxidase with cupredoxin domain